MVHAPDGTRSLDLEMRILLVQVSHGWSEKEIAVLIRGGETEVQCHSGVPLTIIEEVATSAAERSSRKDSSCLNGDDDGLGSPTVWADINKDPVRGFTDDVVSDSAKSGE